MAECQVQIFDRVSEPVWKRLVQKAASFDVQIGGHTGEASKAGFTFHWEYNPQLQTLRLHCKDKPFMVSCGLVTSKLQSLVKECMT